MNYISWGSFVLGAILVGIPAMFAGMLFGALAHAAGVKSKEDVKIEYKMPSRN